MTNYKSKQIFLIFVFTMSLIVSACGQNTPGEKKTKNSSQSANDTNNKEQKYKVTFIELGSVRCIPCQKMQPIMKSIEEKYGDRVKVVFHDVWTDAGAPFAKEYGIKAIPTQVFLDEDGKEFFRHVGFFAEIDLVKVLNSRGVI